MAIAKGATWGEADPVIFGPGGVVIGRASEVLKASAPTSTKKTASTASTEKTAK